jgi:hypothetical protein
MSEGRFALMLVALILGGTLLVAFVVVASLQP